MAFRIVRTLVENLTLEGYWRLPQSRRQVSGTLDFRPGEGIELRLNGTFGDSSQRHGPVHAPVILGYTETGHQVTLLRPTRLGSRLNIPGYFTSRYRAGLAVIGSRWFGSNRRLRFLRFDVAFHNLEDFTGRTGLTTQPPPAGEGLSVEYRRPPVIHFILDMYHVQLMFRGWTAGTPGERVSLEQQAWVTITSQNASALEDVLDGPIRTILDLLELAAGRPVPILAIQASGAKRRAGAPLHHEQGQIDPDEQVEILISQTGVGPSLELRRLHPPDLAFTLAGLGSDVSLAITKWHQARKRLGPMLDLYFSIARMQRTPVEHIFLFLAQAVESYHRRTWPTDPAVREANQKQIRRILTTVRSEADRRWLAEALRYSAEPSLGRRLKDLYETMPSGAKRLLGKKDDFSYRVAITRNYLTHFNKQLRKTALSGKPLRLATLRLRFVLRILLLRELGLYQVSKLPEARILEGELENWGAGS